MKEFNLDAESLNKAPKVDIPSDEEIVTIERAPQIKVKSSKKSTKLQKLTTVAFMIIIALLGLIVIMTTKHFSLMAKYKVPDYEVNLGVTNETEEEETTEYVDEVVYNPTSLGEEVASRQNAYLSSHDLMQLLGDDIWYAPGEGVECAWEFMSGYDYKSAKIDCVWMCTDINDGTLYAYRMATYDAATESFIDPIVHTTKNGGETLAAD